METQNSNKNLEPIKNDGFNRGRALGGLIVVAVGTVLLGEASRCGFSLLVLFMADAAHSDRCLSGIPSFIQESGMVDSNGHRHLFF